MNPYTKVILTGRPRSGGPPTRHRRGRKEVLHYIFAIDAESELVDLVSIRKGEYQQGLRSPVFVAESPDPVKWARQTRAQHKRGGVALWLHERASEGSKPVITLLEEVWVPEGSRRSPRLAEWVRKLNPTLQGTKGASDPTINDPIIGG